MASAPATAMAQVIVMAKAMATATEMATATATAKAAAMAMAMEMASAMATIMVAMAQATVSDNAEVSMSIDWICPDCIQEQHVAVPKGFNAPLYVGMCCVCKHRDLVYMRSECDFLPTPAQLEILDTNADRRNPSKEG
jgi:membrane protease subunit (stomatin/prohibitin family)